MNRKLWKLVIVVMVAAIFALTGCNPGTVESSYDSLRTQELAEEVMDCQTEALACQEGCAADRADSHACFDACRESFESCVGEQDWGDEDWGDEDWGDQDWGDGLTDCDPANLADCDIPDDWDIPDDVDVPDDWQDGAGDFGDLGDIDLDALSNCVFDAEACMTGCAEGLGNITDITDLNDIANIDFEAVLACFEGCAADIQACMGL
jgi:hypothetical protein